MCSQKQDKNTDLGIFNSQIHIFDSKWTAMMSLFDIPPFYFDP